MFLKVTIAGERTHWQKGLWILSHVINFPKNETYLSWAREQRNLTLIEISDFYQFTSFTQIRWSNFDTNLTDIYKPFVMFLNQHDDFLKTLLIGLSHFIALCNGFFKSFHIFIRRMYFSFRYVNILILAWF